MQIMGPLDPIHRIENLGLFTQQNQQKKTKNLQMFDPFQNLSPGTPSLF